MPQKPDNDFYPFGLRGRSDVIRPMDYPHRHTEIELFSSDSGAFTRNFGGDIQHFDNNEIVVFWGCIPHQLLKMPLPGYGFIGYFPLQTFLGWHLPKAFVQLILGGVSIRVRRSEKVEVALDALKMWLPCPDMVGHMPAYAEHLIIEGCMGVIADEGLKNVKIDNNGTSTKINHVHVSRMIEYIVRHRGEAIDSEDICSHVGLHPTYGRTLFKRTLGISLKQFLINHRIEHAKNLLANSDSLILDIALESGFGSVSRFHALFKERTGLTPRKFRQVTVSARH